MLSLLMTEEELFQEIEVLERRKRRTGLSESVPAESHGFNLPEYFESNKSLFWLKERDRRNS